MKREKINTNRIKINKIVFIFSLLLFLAIIVQLARIALSSTVNGVDLEKFKNARNTEKDTLYANRGTIYSVNGEPLAQNVDSYTVIAYLSEKRSKGFKKPQHVVDKEATAEALSPLINMTKEKILALLNKTNLYQVELGPGGKGISELTKEAIEKLSLSGIAFVQTHKRYYPNNDFLSYTIGYVQNKDGKLIGEMGIESYYNDYLTGKDGYLEYQKDLYGYKIPNTPEIKKEAEDGMDLYLTIDENIQMFVERIIDETNTTYNPEWMIMTVVEAKTGRILASGSSPSFDPNIKDIKSYINPLTSYTFEPGSTMKTFTYMAAIEKGTYNGSATYPSGTKTIGKYTINDWNNSKGWGTISFDLGYSLSSNVGAATIMDRFLSKSDLTSYLKDLGFGSKTGITLPNEAAGTVNFKYEVEIANAAFGQGITITPIQYLQALTSIANDGTVIKPYIVDKIVDPNTNKIIYQGKREEVRKVASTETINKIKQLMWNVVNLTSAECTGYIYKVAGYDIIGKTGTSQYVDSKTGKYYTGSNEYIRSFGGMFPKDNPKVIIYTVIKKPSWGGSAASASSTKKLIQDIATYLNIYNTTTTQSNIDVISYEMPNLINKTLETASSIIAGYQSNLIVIGNGNKIINQYPNKDNMVDNKDNIFVVTDGLNITMPSLINLSGRDALTYCNLVGMNCTFSGYGYVTSQNVPIGTPINKDSLITLTLASKIE
ncbi:MAG: penicillin-binding transpeptidase domain-containing protein [Bacilli bacterium]|nr:penicillin-binding transpeptidase domain-containing protein [Bacilli bacterium]